jgi:hypothetical protein
MDNPVGNNPNISGSYTKIAYSSQPEDGKPDLDAADRRLLDDFVSGKNRAVTPELTARFLYHYRQNILEYTGWQGEKRFNQHAVFLDTLAGAYDLPLFFERLETRLLAGKQPKEYLTHFSPREAETLLRYNEKDFLQKYDDLQRDLKTTPPGPLRVHIFRAIGDLRSLALARGISLVVQDNLTLEKQIPGLTYTEYQDIERIDNYARLAGGRGTSPHLEYFKKTFADFARQYFTATGSHKKDLSMALVFCERAATKFGVRAIELDGIMEQACRANNCDLKGKDRINTMEQLQYVFQSAEVSPDGLPGEIKEILAKTGYWDLVKNNLSNIVFTDRLSSGGWETSGLAEPFLRRVKVAIDDPDRKLKSAWKIADILIHEAAHVDRAWRARPAILHNTVPKERHAYAVELPFFDAYLKIYGPPEDFKEFNDTRNKLVRIIRTANQILGYALDDLSAENAALPDARLCRQRGVSSIYELDLSYYPAYPGPSFLADKSAFDKLLAHYPALDRATAGLLWEVAEGQAELAVSIRQGKASADELPLIALYRSTGKLELSGQQTKQLARFFTLIISSASGLKVESPYLSLRLFGSPRQHSGNAPAVYRISSASLRNRLYEIDLINNSVK